MMSATYELLSEHVEAHREEWQHQHYSLYSSALVKGVSGIGPLGHQHVVRVGEDLVDHVVVIDKAPHSTREPIPPGMIFSRSPLMDDLQQAQLDDLQQAQLDEALAKVWKALSTTRDEPTVLGEFGRRTAYAMNRHIEGDMTRIQRRSSWPVRAVRWIRRLRRLRFGFYYRCEGRGW